MSNVLSLELARERARQSALNSKTTELDGGVRAIRERLSGSKPKMHSFDAVWWNSRSRFRHAR
jgi:hypothetical protein